MHAGRIERLLPANPHAPCAANSFAAASRTAARFFKSITDRSGFTRRSGSP
jgi:hypothetical protein